MVNSTRTALKLAPGATDADGAAALDKGGHQVTLRDLEKSDLALVLYLKKQAPETYSRMHEAQYGKKPAATKLATPMDRAKASQQNASDKTRMEKAKVKLVALGSNVTLRDLEKSDPALVLELKHHAPDDYQRLFAATYGSYAKDVPAPAGGVINLASPPTAGSYRDKAPVHLTMDVKSDPDVIAQLPKLGELADNPRFERLD